MPFGKHEGRSLPELIFDEPQWFFWSYQKRILSDVYESKSLINLFDRTTSIKIPPGEDGAPRVADYHYTRHTNLKGIWLRKETEQSLDTRGIIKTLGELDIAFSLRHRKTRYHAVFQPVIDIVRREYFGGRYADMSPQAAREFFLNRENFLRGI